MTPTPTPPSAGEPDNPCEKHTTVKASGYCPICLVAERDALAAELVKAREERDAASMCADITQTGFHKIADKCDQLGAINKKLIERATEAESNLKAAKQRADAWVRE